MSELAYAPAIALPIDSSLDKGSGGGVHVLHNCKKVLDRDSGNWIIIEDYILVDWVFLGWVWTYDDITDTGGEHYDDLPAIMQGFCTDRSLPDTGSLVTLFARLINAVQ